MSETQSPPPRHGSEAIPGLMTERVKRRTLLILAGAAVAVGLMVVFGIPAIREHLRQRQVRDLLAESAADLDDGEVDKAARAAGQAYQIDPRNPETLRLMAKSLEQMPGGMPGAAYFWRQVIEAQQATTEDAVAYGTILLRNGFRDDARKILDSLSPTEKATRPGLELRAAFLNADGHTSEAEELLRAAYAGDRGNPESQLKLAVLDLSSPFPEVQESAVDKLWQIAQSGGRGASHAMSVLASQARLNTPQAIAMRNLLDKIPKASDERRLTIVSGILRALPTQRESIIAAETARQKGRPFEETATFIKWLGSNNEHERVLSLLPASQAIRSADLFLPYVTAMEHAQRSKELLDLIRRYPSVPIPPATRALILARCAQSLKEPSDIVRGHLQDGLKRAWLAKDRTTVMSIGNTADEFGHPDVAVEAFSLLASQPHLKLPMLERVLQIRQRQHDLPAMIEIMDRCLKEQPGNPGYIETWCYLKLLQGTEMERVADAIRHLIETRPERLPTASLVEAFAAYRFGNLDLAGREAKSVAIARLPPGQRAVLAGILQACGRDAEALRVAEKVPKSIVLDEESRFLQSAF